MNPQAAQNYLKTKVLTATPEQLLEKALNLFPTKIITTILQSP